MPIIAAISRTRSAVRAGSAPRLRSGNARFWRTVIVS